MRPEAPIKKTFNHTLFKLFSEQMLNMTRDFFSLMM